MLGFGATSESDPKSKWSEALSIEVLFHRLIPSAGAEPCVLRPMTTHQVECLELAIEELDAICPEITRDFALHVRHVCLMDVARWHSMEDSEYREIGQSMSRHVVPSCVFLSLHAFRSQQELRESLLHESLHRKLGNLVYSEDILRRDYSGGSKCEICLSLES